MTTKNLKPHASKETQSLQSVTFQSDLVYNNNNNNTLTSKAPSQYGVQFKGARVRNSMS